MGKKGKNKGISRIDSGSTHGWFVRGYRNGRTFSKLFSDRKCGNKKKALQLAQDYRDELFRSLQSIPTKPRRRRVVFRDSRNKTGILGVTKTTRVGPNGSRNESYSVSWRPAPGVQKCTSFSIRKYGEKKAFKLAVAHRRKKLAEIYGPSILKKMDAARKD